MAFAQRSPYLYPWSDFAYGPGGWGSNSVLLHLPSMLLLLVLDRIFWSVKLRLHLAQWKGFLVELQMVAQVLLSALALLTLRTLGRTLT